MVVVAVVVVLVFVVVVVVFVFVVVVLVVVVLVLVLVVVVLKKQQQANMDLHACPHFEVAQLPHHPHVMKERLPGGSAGLLHLRGTTSLAV